MGLEPKGANVLGNLILPRIYPHGTTNLTSAHCEVFTDYSAAWMRETVIKKDGSEEPSGINHPLFVLSGFLYSRFGNPLGDDGVGEANRDVSAVRIHWLLSQPAQAIKTYFDPQPWKQAAAVLGSMGYERAAQKVSIEGKVRERLADSTPGSQKIVNWILHKIADYGYNPWKSVAVSLAIIFVFALFFSAAGKFCTDSEDRCPIAVFSPTKEGDFLEEKLEDHYPSFNSLSYSLGSFVPIFDLGTESFWRPNNRSTVQMNVGDGKIIFPLGSIIYIAFLIERFIGAMIIAITVTGFTGLLTRSDR